MRLVMLLALLGPMAVMASSLSPATLNKQTVADHQARVLEEQIIALLEALRTALINGIPELNIPSFAPLNIPELVINLDELNLQGISGIASIHNFILNGVPDWSLDNLAIEIKVLPPKATLIVDVQWPAGSVEGTYDIDVSIFDHTIVGAGNIKGDLSGLRFELNGAASVLPLPPKVTEAKFVASLISSHLEMGTLALDGEDWSERITTFANDLPTFLAENEVNIQLLVDQVVIPAINYLIESIFNGQGK